MSHPLLDNLLVKTDTLLERLLRRQMEREAVSFRQHLSNPGKILLVLGEDLLDLALSVGFIRSVTECFPEAEVGILVAPGQACLLENIPRVRPIGYGQRSPHPFDGEFRRVTTSLRQENFDWAVDLSFESTRSAGLLLYNSGAIIRTGMPGPENERYYNLILKRREQEPRFIHRLKPLFDLLQVKGPFDPPEDFIHPTSKERQKAARFIRMRKGWGRKGEFVGCALHWDPAQKNLARNLHTFVEELYRSLDAFHLLLPTNLAPGNELERWDGISNYLRKFANLKNMLAALEACDKVITNSAGLASLLARLGTRVGLMDTNKEHLARLGMDDLKRLQIISQADDQFPLKPALEYVLQ